MEALFNKARPKTLRSEVVSMLREAIISGKLQPGDHLKETTLAEQMAVSRSPVREAFRELEQEGLIVSVPNQGCFVKTFNAEEIQEIFTLRAALENLAYELIIGADKLGPEQMQTLASYVERQKAAIQNEAIDELTNLDMDFHEEIMRMAGHKRLLGMWRSLRGQIQVLFYQRFHVLDQVPETVDSDHHELLAALRTGNIDTITRLNKEINARVAQDCINVFVSSRQGAQHEE